MERIGTGRPLIGTRISPRLVDVLLRLPSWFMPVIRLLEPQVIGYLCILT